MSLSDVISKVKKLLSLAKSDNPHEAAAAAAAANRLIDEHRLATADLEASDATGQSEPIGKDAEPLLESGRVVAWKMRLALTLAKHYGVFLYNDKGGLKANTYQMVGRKSDIEVTRYMFAWLTSEVTRQIRKHGKGRGSSFGASYGLGFASGVAEQLAASREAAASNHASTTTTTTSTALVAINARGSEARVWAANNSNTRFTKGKTATHTYTDGSAFQAGKQSGRNTHLGTAVGSGSTTRMLA